MFSIFQLFLAPHRPSPIGKLIVVSFLLHLAFLLLHLAFLLLHLAVLLLHLAVLLLHLFSLLLLLSALLNWFRTKSINSKLKNFKMKKTMFNLYLFYYSTIKEILLLTAHLIIIRLCHYKLKQPIINNNNLPLGQQDNQDGLVW